MGGGGRWCIAVLLRLAGILSREESEQRLVKRWVDLGGVFDTYLKGCVVSLGRLAFRRRALVD